MTKEEIERMAEELFPRPQGEFKQGLVGNAYASGLHLGFKEGILIALSLNAETAAGFDLWRMQNRWVKPLLRGEIVYWHNMETQEQKTSVELFANYLESLKG